jgi:hypothetical protein
VHIALIPVDGEDGEESRPPPAHTKGESASQPPMQDRAAATVAGAFIAAHVAAQRAAGRRC